MPVLSSFVVSSRDADFEIVTNRPSFVYYGNNIKPLVQLVRGIIL